MNKNFSGHCAFGFEAGKCDDFPQQTRAKQNPQQTQQR